MVIRSYRYNIKKIKKEKKKDILLVMGALRTDCLSNFPVYHTAVLTVAIMFYITPLVLIYLITGSLCLLTTFLQSPSTLLHLW